MGLILLLLLILLLFGAYPWGGWHTYGPYPSGIVGFLLVLVIVLLLLRVL
jgi:hypothetical protein